MKRINKILLGFILLAVTILPNSTFALEKEETIYTNLSYLGKNKQSTVVNKLEYKGEEEIIDESELKDILNINGNEKYKKDGETIIWKTDKKDIFYQGKSDKKLPIEVDIKYYLNGKKIKPKKLKGKKGDIKVVMNFKNNEAHTYNGKTIYTPFAVTVGTMMDSTKNTDIKVTNGKVIETGTKSMIVALASPGLYDSIRIDSIKNLDEVSFTYHTDKFSQENIYVVATPKLLDEKDLDIFNKMDDKLEKVDELQKGTDELQKGSEALANGTTTLKNELGNKLANLQNSDNNIVGETAKNSVINELNNNLYNLVQNTVYNVVKTKVGACSNLTGDNYNNCIIPTYSEITTGLNGVINYHISQGGSTPSEDNIKLAGLISYQVSGILSTTDYHVYIENESTMSAYIIPTFNEVFNGIISSYGNIAKTVSISTANEAKNQTIESLQTMYQAVSQVNDGAIKIKDGVNTLNKSGINSISNLADSYKDYSDIVSELKRLSKNYNGFTSKNSKNTKFIYKIKSIK